MILLSSSTTSSKSGNQGEEITVVPNNLVRNKGVEPSEIAQTLADYFPCYRVKTEQDFYDMCDSYENFLESKGLKGERQ